MPVSRWRSSWQPIAISRATRPTRSSSPTEPLPVVVDPELAMTGQPTVIHAGFPNNLAVALVPGGTGVSADGKTVDDSAIDQAFAAAEVVVSQRMLNQRLVPNAMEPRGVVAHYEPGKELLTIWSSTQNPHILKTHGGGACTVSASTRCAPSRLRSGGGFGAKINIYAEEYVAAGDFEAARASGEMDLEIRLRRRSSPRRTAVTSPCHIDLAAKRDGTLLGVKMRLVADIGAYNMLLTAAVPTLTMLMASATYRIPAIRVTLTEVFTNKTPTDAYRGAGQPEATYFVERGLDMLRCA